MLFKNTLFTLLLLSVLANTTLASDKEKGDKKFKDLSYVRAIELYHSALENDNDSTVINNLAQSYLHIHKFDQSVKWYKVLYSSNSLEKTETDLFYYTEALKATGNYDELKRISDTYHNENAAIIDQFSPEELRKLKDQIGRYEVYKTNINTKNSDCSPVFRSQDQIVFMSDRKIEGIKWLDHPWSGEHFYNLLIADVPNIDSLQTLENVRSLSSTINTKYDEGPATFSADRNSIIYSATVTNQIDSLSTFLKDKKIANMQLLYTSYDSTESEWKEAQLFPLIDSIKSIEHPSLSWDGQYLLFSSDHPWDGHQGKYDIYMLKKTGDSTWSQPINLGPDINTPGNEGFPFLHETGRLFFASDGHPGLGQLDVFVSTTEDFASFKPALNLGDPVNTPSDDFGMTFDKTLEYGYFSSDRADGEGLDDIYAVKFIPYLEVAGTVFEKGTNSVVDSSLVKLYDGQGKVIDSTYSSSDGTYSFEVDHRTNYLLATTKSGFKGSDTTSFIENDIYVRSIKQDLFITEPIFVTVTETENLQQLVILPINFDFDKYYIVDEDKPNLDKIAGILTKDSLITVDITSHTDCRGSINYNIWLSNQRAKSTKEYLIAQGVNPSQIISAKGEGETSPYKQCECSGGPKCDKKQHRLNRRSEFLLKKEQTKVIEAKVSE